MSWGGGDREDGACVVVGGRTLECELGMSFLFFLLPALLFFFLSLSCLFVDIEVIRVEYLSAVTPPSLTICSTIEDVLFAH